MLLKSLSPAFVRCFSTSSTAAIRPEKASPLVTATSSSDKGLLEFQANTAIPAGTRVHMSVPYVKAVTFQCAQAFCAHCHVAIGHRSFQSQFNQNFYEFESCRDYFDGLYSSLFHELQTDCRSRFDSNRKTLQLRTGSRIGLNSEAFTLINGLIAIIAKKVEEDLRDGIVIPPLVLREEKKCVPIQHERDSQLLIPTYREFAKLPLREESIDPAQREVFHLLSEAIMDVLSQRNAYSVVSLEKSDLYAILCRMHQHQRRIIRQAGPYGAACDTGFGVYPSSFPLQLSNLPNCGYFFDYNANIVVFTLQPVSRGESISIGSFPRLLEEVDQNLGSVLMKLYFTPVDQKREIAAGAVETDY
jgi:hypothetical protein